MKGDAFYSTERLGIAVYLKAAGFTVEVVPQGPRCLFLIPIATDLDRAIADYEVSPAWRSYESVRRDLRDRMEALKQGNPTTPQRKSPAQTELSRNAPDQGATLNGPNECKVT